MKSLQTPAGMTASLCIKRLNIQYGASKRRIMNLDALTTI